MCSSDLPLKRVVLIAGRGLLSVNNLAELAALQAALKAPGPRGGGGLHPCRAGITLW